MEKYFLGRNKTNDRDCVKYIEFGGFECNHYFSSFHICGANFCGFEEDVFNNIDNFETILTKDELMQLKQYGENIKELGYGIELNSEKYNKGIELRKGIQNIIDRLSSGDNEEFQKNIIEEEKEYCVEYFGLSKDDVDYIFDEYRGFYQDRGIISCVFNDEEELAEEEMFSFGYENIPYFDKKAFAEDLIDSENYIQLDNGKIVSLAY